MRNQILVSRILAALGFAFVVIVPSVGAQVSYRVQDVGTLLNGPGAHFSYTYGVNSSGQLVGFSYVLTGYRAFLYEPTTDQLFNLGDLPGGDDFSVARAVSEAGVVVGHSTAMIDLDGTPTLLSRAFKWESGGGILDLGAESMNGGHSHAYAINSLGQITGDYAPVSVATYVWQAFLLSPGEGFQFLPHLDPSHLPSTYGYGLNSSGLVVGESSSQNIAETAFRWTGASGIETLSGDTGPASSAGAVTDAGVIAGAAIIDDGQGGYVKKPFYWFPGGPIMMIELLPGMILGEGYSLNTRDFVVGRNALELGSVCINPDFPPPPICYSDTATDRAFLWSSATGTNQLDTMIDPGDPLYGSLQLSSAWGISSNGYIAANGYISGQTGQHAFLLIPDLLFADGFERGNMGAWSRTAP